MDTPQTNPEGLQEDLSALSGKEPEGQAADYPGLERCDCSATALPSPSSRLASQQGIQPDFFVYPGEPHNMRVIRALICMSASAIISSIISSKYLGVNIPRKGEFTSHQITNNNLQQMKILLLGRRWPSTPIAWKIAQSEKCETLHRSW